MKAKSSLLMFLCVLTLGLTGCASKSVQKDFSFNSEQNNGMIVLSVSHDLTGGRRAKAIFYLDGGVLSAKDGKMFFSLNEAVPGIATGSDFQDSYGQLLVIALPAGKHEISSWQISNGTGLRISPKETPVPLVFDVNKGEIKYLGNLHANLQTGKNVFGMTITGNGFPEVRDQRKRDIAMFEEKYPQFKGKVAMDLVPLGPWLATAETHKQVDLPMPVLPVPVRK